MLLVVAICLTFGGVLLGVRLDSPVARPTSEKNGSGAGPASQADTSTPVTRGAAVTPRPAPSPVGLRIPAIDLAAPVIRLGLMPDRTVEVPSDPDQAGWFHRGPVPGWRGSAVILGHVDSAHGPAVFARLQELRPGDIVIVERADGSNVQFVVRETVLVANEDFPADRVYAAPSGRRLNLVTCGGAYDATAGGYQSNLVIYTSRADPPVD